MFYNARWYDSAAGRFASPDSIIQDPNNTSFYDRYSYVINNPLRYVDPSGHLTDDEIKKWTYYNIPKLKENNLDLYNMLRALHLGDSVFYHKDGKVFNLGMADLDAHGLLTFNGEYFDLTTLDNSGWIVTRQMGDGTAKVAYFSGDFPYLQDYEEETPYIFYEKNEITTFGDELAYNLWLFFLNEATWGLMGLNAGLLIPDPGVSELVLTSLSLIVGMGQTTVQVLRGGPHGTENGDVVQTYYYSDGSVQTIKVRPGQMLVIEWSTYP
jgi:hypothetical protein